MSLRDVGNTIQAVEPFSSIEVHSYERFGWQTSFRADRRYFESFPRRQFAVRQALDEFDILALFGDDPPPPLYVFVTRVSTHQHTVEPIYRGSPFWPERYCGQFKFASLESDTRLFALRLHCRDLGGMDIVAREQFNKHNRAVSQRRQLLSI